MVRFSILLVFAVILLSAFGQAAPKLREQAPATRIDNICKQLGGGC